MQRCCACEESLLLFVSVGVRQARGEEAGRRGGGSRRAKKLYMMSYDAHDEWKMTRGEEWMWEEGVRAREEFMVLFIDYIFSGK